MYNIVADDVVNLVLTATAKTACIRCCIQGFLLYICYKLLIVIFIFFYFSLRS